MSKNGVAALSFLPPVTTMNGPKYVHMLSKKLKLHMQVHQRQIFMQDGALCHHSNVAKTFLVDNNIEVLKWPRNSLDLNPIENLWTNMKNKVSEKQPSSGAELANAIREGYVKKNFRRGFPSLIERRTKRMKAVIRNREGHRS